MTQPTIKTQEVDLMDVRLAKLPFYLPDAGSTAENVLAKALEFAADKTGAANIDAIVQQLRRGNPVACQYATYGLARQVAEALGDMDETVQAVYTFQDAATPEDAALGEQPPDTTVHLIVWVARKTKALAALVQGLDRALIERYGELIGAGGLAHLLDVQLVDDVEVRNRTGYAALLTSLHNRPILVWQR